jgi:hypothetical protein
MKEVNYNVIQGDSFQLALTYTDSSGAAINLTGASAYMEVRDKPGGQILCATASGASGAAGDGITFTASAGQINLNLTPAKTSAFITPRAAYQLQLTSSGGIKNTLLTGWFLVNSGVINS